MKTSITKLLILSSVTLFIGCSSKTPETKAPSTKNVSSVYKIMGIEKSTKNTQTPLFVVKDEHSNDNTIEIISYGSRDNNYISDNIEVISYGSYSPETQELYSVNNKRLNKEIEWNAKSFLGTKYVWGATGPSTFDCSGFTQWIYRDAGIDIPRVSRDQAKVGRYVNYHNLKHGDMVFFDTKKRRNGVVSHVGIYLGNGNFIHASSSAKKVVIYNFNDKPFYKKRFMWGRRVIQESQHLAYN